MSYAFTKCVEAQAAFETSEELFVKFLTSLISTIIDPFKSLSFSKFNITKKEISQLNIIFNSILNLYNFHLESHNKLDQPQIISTTSNNLDVTVVTSPPPNTYNKSNPYKNRHHRTHSPGIGNTQFQQNLNSFIFKYYEHLPIIYKQFFDICINNLVLLSNIITPKTNIKKWFKIKCDDITLLYDNTQPYHSFSQILRDIIIHGKDQSLKLQEIAKSKYLKNSLEAKAFKENMRIHLEHILKNWDDLYRQQFDLLTMEFTLTQTNECIFTTDRSLMLTFQIDLPTKARSTTNLFGLNSKKFASQTQEGIFYIFNDLVLICTKEQKYKGKYSLYNNTNTIINFDKNKNRIIFQNGINDKKKITVFMRKSEEFKVALEAIKQYQKELRNIALKCVVNNSDLLPDYTTHKKSPPIPIMNHNNTTNNSFRITNMTPESVYSVSHSYSNPKFGHINNIQKSLSYPSQSISYNNSFKHQPKITPSPSMTQLEANTHYNRGIKNNKQQQRSSMQSNKTDITFSVLTENTMYNDISEPRTSNAFSIQQTPVNTTYRYDSNSVANSIATPISDNKWSNPSNSNVSSDKQSLIIHEEIINNNMSMQPDEDYMHFIDSDNDDNNMDNNDNDDDYNDHGTVINDTEKREKFKLYREESINHGRRFSVPSMLSSIASSGKGNSTDNDEILKEPSPNYKGINQLEVSDSDGGSSRDHKSPKFNKIRKRSKSMLAKQVRFKNNNSNNSYNNNNNNNNNIIIDDIQILKENEIIINLNNDKTQNNNNNNNNNLNGINNFDHLDGDIPIYDEEDILGKDEMANLSEEEYLIEEHNDILKGRDEMANLDINAEDTPSIEMIDDPHDLANVEFISEDYTSDDDHSFKMKVLFKPKWAINDEVGVIREYPPLPVKQYYEAHNDILDPLKYSENMHKYKLKLQQHVEQKCNEIRNDNKLSKKKKEQIIEQITNETSPKETGLGRHPFERFLDEMHQYETDGDNTLIKNNNKNNKNNKNNNKHQKYQSAELQFWDANNEEINDDETNNFLSIIDDKKPSLQQNQLSNVSNSHSLELPNVDNTTNSVSSLGPSPSVLQQMQQENDDEKDNSVMAPIDSTEAETLRYTIATPTANVLERFNLQTNNCLLLAELQRLRNIISLQDDEINGMDTEIEYLNATINDKEIQTKTLRQTNITIKNRNNDLDLKNNQLSEKISEILTENIELKKDNNRLNDLVRDYENAQIIEDNDSASCNDLHHIPQQPAMKVSKSDISSFIAPELVKHSNNEIKKQKFNDYTQMRGVNSIANASGSSSDRKKKKNKIYRKKYHSITLSQVKKDYMKGKRNKLRNRTGTAISPLQNRNNNDIQSIDHLTAVKSKLRDIKVGLMPQSQTQITPQHSCRGTPRNGRSTLASVKKLSEKSLFSATSSIENDENISSNNALHMSLYGPCSAPSAPSMGFHSSNSFNLNDNNMTFGSPTHSPSPNGSPLPNNNSNNNVFPVPDRPKMIDIKGKSYDNIHNIHKINNYNRENRNLKENKKINKCDSPSPMSPTSTGNGISNHKRKDTPTPNKMKSNKFVYTKLGQTDLEQIQSTPNAKGSNLSATNLMDKNRINTNGNKRRISFANHHKMHYVEDDDQSDLSITNRSFNKTLSNLSKRRITYTKSANQLYTSEHKSSSTNQQLYTTNYHKTQTPKPKPDIPLYFSRGARGHSQSFSVQKSRPHRSGSISTKSSYSLGLKDRTGKGNSNNKPSNIKTNSLPSKKLYTPTTPQIQSYVNINKRGNKSNRTQPKRRSVNFTSSHQSLKPKPSDRKKLYSKSPNFEPKSIPSTYPNTFNDFTLDDK